MKYLFLGFLALFLNACNSDGVNDGSQGPSSSNTTESRISNMSVDTSLYHDSVEIEAVKRFNTEGVAVDIALSTDSKVVYIASGSGGLEVIDVRSPSSPKLLYSYDLPEYVNYVEVVDDVVYVAYIAPGVQSYQRVYAFDVYNPYKPNYLGSASGDNGVGHSSVVQGDYYYEVNSEGLEIYRHVSTQSYAKVGSYYLHDTAYALALHNNYIFIANGREGLTILKTDIATTVGRVH